MDEKYLEEPTVVEIDPSPIALDEEPAIYDEEIIEIDEEALKELIRQDMESLESRERSDKEKGEAIPAIDLDDLLTGQLEVFPINAHGFVLWESERYRFESNTYEPLEDEIVEPIPSDTVWVAPRWDGTQWVEGKDHPNLPTRPKPDLPFPDVPMPDEGIYWLTNGDRSIQDMAEYLLKISVDETDVLLGTHHINDSRLIPVLLQMIQDLQKRVVSLEQGEQTK